MRVSAIGAPYQKQVLKISKNNNLKQDVPPEKLQMDTTSFKGIKNALRAGSLGVIAGAIIGSIFLPGLGTAAGAATMAAIAGGAFGIRGAMESDKNNILKD